MDSKKPFIHDASEWEEIEAVHESIKNFFIKFVEHFLLEVEVGG